MEFEEKQHSKGGSGPSYRGKNLLFVVFLSIFPLSYTFTKKEL